VYSYDRLGKRACERVHIFCVEKAQSVEGRTVPLTDRDGKGHPARQIPATEISFVIYANAPLTPPTDAQSMVNSNAATRKNLRLATIAYWRCNPGVNVTAR